MEGWRDLHRALREAEEDLRAARRRCADAETLRRLRAAVNRARAAAREVLPATPALLRPAELLASRAVDGETLLRSVLDELPEASAPRSAGVLRRAPRQIVRAVWAVVQHVAAGGFGRLHHDARPWFRVAPAALDAWGAPEVGELARRAWKIAESEHRAGRSPLGNRAFETVDAAYGPLGPTIVAGTEAFVRAHWDALALDEPRW